MRTIPVSTGNNRRYCVDGHCEIARTPRGRFKVQRRISGWRVSHLGRLYNPLYFTGGYAIHGGALALIDVMYLDGLPSGIFDTTTEAPVPGREWTFG